MSAQARRVTHGWHPPLSSGGPTPDARLEPSFARWRQEARARDDPGEGEGEREDGGPLDAPPDPGHGGYRVGGDISGGDARWIRPGH